MCGGGLGWSSGPATVVPPPGAHTTQNGTRPFAERILGATPPDVPKACLGNVKMS